MDEDLQPKVKSLYKALKLKEGHLDMILFCPAADKT
jgi:hypothetical protein